jgi:1-acyl-sn-glycerol-3-phosphate acyltransferase
MQPRFYGPLTTFARILFRLYFGHHEVAYSSAPPVPSIYLVHHQDTIGPLTVIAWLGTHFHIWALSVFLTQRECFGQYARFTFSTRLRMPRPIAMAVALPASLFVSSLLRSSKAIPVYRESAKIMSTMRQTLAVLKAGESVLISPDIEYTDKSPEIGAMYEGFLNIDRFLWRETGVHVGFVPVHIDRSRHAVIVGNAVHFPGIESFRREKGGVYARIKQEFARLARSAPTSDRTA